MTFNTAESVLFGGLSGVSDAQEETLYLVNEGLLAAVGLISLGWLAFRPAHARRLVGGSAGR